MPKKKEYPHKKGVQSKIEKYDLVQHAVSLLKVIPKLSFQQIADELNALGEVPTEDTISSDNVRTFHKSYLGRL